MYCSNYINSRGGYLIRLILSIITNLVSTWYQSQFILTDLFFKRQPLYCFSATKLSSLFVSIATPSSAIYSLNGSPSNYFFITTAPSANLPYDQHVN
jgi:hypothetical protein